MNNKKRKVDKITTKVWNAVYIEAFYGSDGSSKIKKYLIAYNSKEKAYEGFKDYIIDELFDGHLSDLYYYFGDNKNDRYEFDCYIKDCKEDSRTKELLDLVDIEKSFKKDKFILKDELLNNRINYHYFDESGDRIYAIFYEETEVE